MRDLYNNVKSVVSIAPAVYDDDNTPVSIDRQGAESLAIVLMIGIGGITFTDDNKVEFKLTHSVNNTDWDAVTLADVQGVTAVGTGGIVQSLIAAHAAATHTKIGYVGGRRYVRLLADFGGTHATGTPLAAVAVLGDVALGPVA